MKEPRSKNPKASFDPEDLRTEGQYPNLNKVLIYPIKKFLVGYWILVFGICLCLAFPPFLEAQENLKMVFIYPGGEGSEEDAQPLLDLFCEQIKKNGGPSIKAKYIPELGKAIKTIKNKSAHLGILSLDFYLEQNANNSFEILLSTHPINSKNPTERYYVLASKTNSSVEKTKNLFASRPLNKKFVENILLKKFPSENISFKTMANLVPLLKTMGKGESDDYALVDSFEYDAIKKLSLKWAKNLKTIHTSSPVPASPLVSLTKLSEETKRKLITSFMKMSKSKEGKEILASLRLRGFAKPNRKNHLAIQEAFLRAVSAEPKIPALSPN